MSVDRCPDCGVTLIDAGFYYNHSHPGKRARRSDNLQCPKCQKIRPYKEWQ